MWTRVCTRAYLAYTGDLEFVRNELYPVFADIIAWHTRGTRYGIKVDPSGLLNSGEPGVQLTWMDAKVGDWVVTPRRGKPVEIQALWYNALCIPTKPGGSVIEIWRPWRVGVSIICSGTRMPAAYTTW